MEHIDKLRDEYYAELEMLSKMDVGTEAYKITVEGITKLADRITEAERRASEQEERAAKEAAEEKQKREDRFFRIISLAVPLITAAMSLGVTIWGIKTSLNIEFGKNEIQTSTAGKKLLGSAISTKF